MIFRISKQNKILVVEKELIKIYLKNKIVMLKHNKFKIQTNLIILMV